MTRERIIIHLRIGIVDRSGNQHVVETSTIISHGTIERLYCSQSRVSCRHTHIHFHLVIYSSQKIDSSILYILSLLNDRELTWQVHGLAIIGCHFWRAIYNRCTEFQHFWLCKGFKNEFISDTIGISVGDSHPYFLIVHILFFDVFI